MQSDIDINYYQHLVTENHSVSLAYRIPRVSTHEFHFPTGPSRARLEALGHSSTYQQRPANSLGGVCNPGGARFTMGPELMRLCRYAEFPRGACNHTGGGIEMGGIVMVESAQQSTSAWRGSNRVEAYYIHSIQT